jgi:hypothetical protein
MRYVCRPFTKDELLERCLEEVRLRLPSVGVLGPDDGNIIALGLGGDL